MVYWFIRTLPFFTVLRLYNFSFLWDPFSIISFNILVFNLEGVDNEMIVWVSGKWIGVTKAKTNDLRKRSETILQRREWFTYNSYYI